MDNEQLRYRIAFASIRGMGVELARQLLEVAGSERAFFDMSEHELRDATKGHSKIYTNFYRQQQLERADRELDFIVQNHIDTTYFTDADYPRRLLEAEDAPCMLYSRGTCDLNSRHVISMVGTRHATQYGISFCDTFIRDLATALPDAVVVSGLAYGIDIAAHRACLKHGLSTVAVMARGLNGIYPAMHRNDAVKIVRNHGMVLTDGAMYNNNPTNVAYSLGADIVIGLDVSAPVVPEEDVNDVADVLGQVFDLPGMKNQNASRDRMDLKIRPNLEGYNLLMFSKESIDSLMARGYAAAKIAEPDLRAIRELTGPAAPKRKASIDFMSRPVHISGVRLEGVPESEKTAVLRVLGVSEDEDRMLSYEEAEEMAWRLRGTRCYERVIYEFDGESEPLRLVLRCRQQAADRLALSLRFDTETFASVQFDVDRGGFRKGGSLGLSGRVGFHSFLEGGYTYRTWSGWDFSAKVSVHGVFHNYMSGFNGDLGFHRQDARIAAGVNLGTFARVEAGVKAEHLWIPFPDRHRVIASAQARVMGDSFDNGYFPSRGIRFSAGGGYHFLSYDPSGVSLKPFLDADLSFKAVIPIGGHFALLPAVSARYVSKDGASNVVYCNALAPSAGPVSISAVRITLR